MLGIAIGTTVGVGVGIFIGMKYEQKAVAKILAEFAKVDAETRSLVSRCYRYLATGTRKELDKILPVK